MDVTLCKIVEISFLFQLKIDPFQQINDLYLIKELIQYIFVVPFYDGFYKLKALQDHVVQLLFLLVTVDISLLVVGGDVETS